MAAIFHTGADGTHVECEALLTIEVAPTSVEHPKFLGGTPCKSGYMALPAEVLIEGKAQQIYTVTRC